MDGMERATIMVDCTLQTCDQNPTANRIPRNNYGYRQPALSYPPPLRRAQYARNGRDAVQGEGMR